MSNLWKMGLKMGVTLGAVLVAAACSDSTGPGSRPVSLSFATKSLVASGTMSLSDASASDVTVSGGGNTLVITRVQMVFREIELKRSNTELCPDDAPSGSDPCEELALGPMLVDLPLTTGVMTAASVSIPAGTYRELELTLHKPGSGARDSAFKAANPTFADTTIRVQGTYNGRPFVFTSRLDEEMELEFNPPLTIGASGGNVTVQIDVASWFKSLSGAVIDPATANIGGPNEGIVKTNIKASFRSLEDDDRDGK
ncbi:MAG TPA: hypothetical protein VGJ96_04725 [Gemmatimonadaceae bacterium]|jgi:hypothetical protein